MGIFGQEIPRTAVTDYIERLCDYDEEDWLQIQQLTEAILIQESGPREAVTAVRKRLKHGTKKQQLMALSILKVLVENAGSRFHNELLGSEKMHDRLEYIITSPTEDPEVKRQLVELLGIWSKKYKGQPGMTSIEQLYTAGAGRINKHQKLQSLPPLPRTSTPSSSPRSPTISTRAPPANHLDVHAPPSPVSSKRRSLPAPAKPRSSSSATSSSHKFNFTREKPKVVEEVALAQQNAYNLNNAIKFVNVDDGFEAVKDDVRVQEYIKKCEESRKKIVRYARLVEDEEWIGTLLATNEELLAAIHIYEVMAEGRNPAEDAQSSSSSAPPPVLPPRKATVTPQPVLHSALKKNSVPAIPSRQQDIWGDIPSDFDFVSANNASKTGARSKNDVNDLNAFEGLSINSRPRAFSASAAFRSSAAAEDPFADPFADPEEAIEDDEDDNKAVAYAGYGYGATGRGKRSG